MSDDEPSKEELAERVDTLEATIQRMLPSRRDVLKGAAVGAMGVGMGSAATANAMAQPTGNEPPVGEQGDPVEVWASEIDAQSVDAGEGTIDGGDEIPGIPPTSSENNPNFGEWIQVSSGRPSLIEIRCGVETDGSTRGEILIDVDESGGTSADYNFPLAWADPNLGDGGREYSGTTFLLPPGAQYQIRTSQDPNNNNEINAVHEFDL